MDINEQPTELRQDRAERSSRFYTRLHRWQLQARRLWWVPAGCLTLAVGLAVLMILHRPPVYVSNGQMILNFHLQNVEGASYTEELFNYNGTQAALMQSDRVQNKARAKVQADHPNFTPSPVQLTVTPISRTTIFALTATGRNSEYTTAFLQACMDSYIDLKKEMRAQTSETTLASITEELGHAESELRKGEEELVAFQRSNSVVFLQEQGNSASSYLSKLNVDLADKRTEYQLLTMLTLEQNLERQQRSGNSGPSGGDETTDLQSDPTDYLHAKQQIQLLKAQQQELSEFLRPKHPKMVKLAEDIAQREKLLEIFREQSAEQLSSRRESIGLQITNLEAQVKEWQVKSLDTSEKMAEFQKIKSSNQRVQGLYDRLLGTMQTLDINKEISPETVTIKDEASPAVLSRSTVVKSIFLAAIGGLVVGIGILLLVDQLDDRLNSFGELQEHFDEEILGQIPKDPNARNGAPAPLIHTQDDRHAFVEAYRNLRSSLAFLSNSGAKPKIILVTSSIPNDGKTLTTSNLAITIALSGARVLLIDGDLRKGVMHERFKVENKAGLHEAIAENRPWQNLVQPTQAKNLSLLTRGATTQFSSELFLDPKAAALLKDAAAHYDLVIVDSPPVMAADDATSLAPAADGVLFVIRAQQTSTRVARAALDLLYQRRINVLGLVFNAVEANAAEYYYYKYKEYYATYPSK